MAADVERRVDLVFEGGGVKGIGLVGALAVLEERGFAPQNVAGASAGAIVATLHAAGYTAAELRTILLELDFLSFEDRAWEDRVPLLGAPLSVLKDQGVFEGAAFLSWITELLAARGVRTFADLVHPAYADDERFRWRASIVASDLTGRELLVLPRDARSLDIEPDELEVGLAVRMSASIPFFFEPVRIPGPDRREHLIADGGVLSNFPVWIFDVEGEPDWPTFGLLLVEPEPRTPIGERLPDYRPARRWVSGTVDYVKALVQTMLEAHDRLYLEQADFVRTIPIETLGIGTTEFDLAPERAEALYVSGRAAAEDFLARWDFAAYVAEFRTGKRHSRRDEVAADLAEPGSEGEAAAT